jgi:hypothetical protein
MNREEIIVIGGIGLIILTLYIISNPVIYTTYYPSKCDPSLPNFTECWHIQSRSGYCEHHLFGTELCYADSCTLSPFPPPFTLDKLFPFLGVAYLVSVAGYIALKPSEKSKKQ